MSEQLTPQLGTTTTTTTTTTADDALIDDIAAEYPDLAGGGEGHHVHEEDTEMIPPGSAQEQEIHHSDLTLDDPTTTQQHHDHEMDVGVGVDDLAAGDVHGVGVGDGDGEEEGGLTDEALRQFANAAAIHYNLNHHDHDHEHEHEHQEHEHQDLQEHEELNHHHGQEDDNVMQQTQAQVPDHGGETEQLDPSLTQVVTGSIPPPPRPTYHQHPHALAHAATTQSVSETTITSTTVGEKRKRDEYDPALLGGSGGTEQHQQQPIQAQADPLHPLLPLQHRHMILPRAPTITHQHAEQANTAGGESQSPSSGTGIPLPMNSMYPPPRGGNITHSSSAAAAAGVAVGNQPQQNQSPIQPTSNTRSRKPAGSSTSGAAGGGSGSASGRGRVRSQGVLPTAIVGEEMHLTDGGGGEGSDGGHPGRKEGKDERSARRAEQNRRAQQNFRKRREEAMKEQAARLEVLIPQMEEMKRQQAETQLLLEALKLENTALRAVLVQAVKEGAKILDESGELVGATSMPLSGMVGNPFPHAHSHARGSLVDDTGHHIVPPAADVDAVGETPALEDDETGKAVQDVYAALDRLGARTHVYARTIVPVVTADEQQQQDGQQQQMGGGFTAPHSSQHMPVNLPGPPSTTRRQTGAKGMHPQQPAIAQSSMRTVRHEQHQAQGLPYPPPPSYGLNNLSNLPPFPGSGAGTSGRSNTNPPDSANSAASEQMRAVEEAIAEIDPALQDVSGGSALPEPHTHHSAGGGGDMEGDAQDNDGMAVDPSLDVSLS